MTPFITLPIESSLAADNENPAAGRIPPLAGILGSLVPPEPATDKRSTVKQIWEASI